MNENFNRQFILIDFELLDDPQFLQFVGRAEFTTYLILRRYVWRGGQHRLGLRNLYWQKRLLVSAVGRERIAEHLGLKDPTRVSKHMGYLEDIGVVKRMRTGRESIFVLGEWIDISETQDRSKRKEWFYLEQKFGVSMAEGDSDQPNDGSGQSDATSDVSKIATSDVQDRQHQTRRFEPPLMWLKSPHSNREGNREINNTVNVENGDIKMLPDLNQPRDKTEYTAQEILSQLKDHHSKPFYNLVAAKIPEHLIWKTLGEIKQDGARNPARVFTHRMKLYAQEQAESAQRKTIRARIQDLADSKRLRATPEPR